MGVFWDGHPTYGFAGGKFCPLVGGGRAVLVSTRSSAQSLAVLVMLSILPCSSILPCPCLPPVMLYAVHGGSCLQRGKVCLQQGGPAFSRGRGGLVGGGGRGHFNPAAIYCTITWCFALKGLRTMRVADQVKLPFSCRQSSAVIRCQSHRGGWIWLPLGHGLSTVKTMAVLELFFLSVWSPGGPCTTRLM